jgi:NAD(P)-dependent dehydrogenase (short-subunit alcohol dehydrogenase family)
LDYAAQGIRVNAIAPGLVRTPMTERWLNDPEICDSVLADSPIRRAAEPEEIADLVVFLASDEASVITGAVYPIDGARTTH